MYGSYHILYPVTFGDGVRLITKIPKHGVEGEWDKLSAASLSSEACIMRLLKRQTIPLLDVFVFSTSVDNDLGCPYILTSSISGRPLQEVWFSQLPGVTDPDILHSHRVRALQGITSAIVQLGKYTSFVGGAPLFNTNGEWDRLGPRRLVDAQAELDPFSSMAIPVLIPFMWNSGPRLIRSGSTPSCWTCTRPLSPKSKPFVLTHPDFDIQNIMVSEDAHLGDWGPMMYHYPKDDSPNGDSTGDEGSDDAASEGNDDDEGENECEDDDENEDEDGDEDEDMYKDDKENNEHEDDDGEDGESEEPLEDLSETLKRYREVYRQCFLDAQEKQASFSGRLCSLWTRLSNTVWSFFGYPPRSAANGDITRQSLITDNLVIAASHPACRSGILMKVVDEISDILGDDVELGFLISLRVLPMIG
ncbi:hypothetical protein B0J13DRAFT_622133 [Dactylonectria estremocensis]|uniref:Aminoglycoside phosphotransferase domain-containing protein n=1 Tax=Dactylonectria estremocensis TaxID=1079267 RepID=A0A9P9EVI5_9HYPO|nr:hypothetical protein B0J13DRAFT_622133 [Dactylonectria estremocensis]